jgi:hypothetical protein
MSSAAPLRGRALNTWAKSSLNHGAPQARKIVCYNQSAAKTDEEERSNCL